MSWKEYGFNSKEEFIQWIENSNSKEISRRLKIRRQRAGELKRAVNPEIFSILSDKSLSTREMREELKEKGINLSVGTVRLYRKIGIKFGLFERKQKSWSKEKVIQKLREEANRYGKLTQRNVRCGLVNAAVRYFGSWNKALEEAGIKPLMYRSKLLERDLILKLIESEGGVCLVKELYKKEELKEYNRTTIWKNIKRLEEKGEIRIRGPQNYRIIYLPGREKDALFYEIKKRIEGVRRFIECYKRSLKYKLSDEEADELLRFAEDGKIFFEDELTENQRRFVSHQYKRKRYGFVKKEIGGRILYSISPKYLEVLKEAYLRLKGD